MKMKKASGEHLDRIALDLGVPPRKRWWWIFRERDKTLRKRLTAHLCAPRRFDK